MGGTSSSYLGYYNPYTVTSGKISGTWKTILPTTSTETPTIFTGNEGDQTISDYCKKNDINIERTGK